MIPISSVLKGSVAGKWLQYRDMFSNMNIFNSMLQIANMIERTSPGENQTACTASGDYLR